MKIAIAILICKIATYFERKGDYKFGILHYKSTFACDLSNLAVTKQGP